MVRKDSLTLLIISSSPQRDHQFGYSNRFNLLKHLQILNFGAVVFFTLSEKGQNSSNTGGYSSGQNQDQFSGHIRMQKLIANNTLGPNK